MRNITLLIFALALLMAVLQFGTAPSGLSDLAAILFQAFAALCVIALVFMLGSTYGRGMRE